jgi:hypothetical protein
VGTSNKTGVVLNKNLSLVIGVPAVPGAPDVGSLTISGWADGVALAFRQIDEGLSDRQGITGEISLVVSTQNRFEVDITLMQTSNDNLILSSLYQASAKSGVVYPVTFNDASGQTVLAGTSGYFKKFPDFGYAKDPENRTWTMTVGHMDGLLGGNV